ncbi:hypothetical protein SOMG_00831 [Schizosaccharomyces osmophilus]|uniref:Uncharacterized protein n=1 Tax=Schizosaccharomyces osmophilus TaxID=2545709 RepID=A0AAF0AVS3_9SCHI|nr:uncharacterized protein SOMG_00831 [Schizosaccharomyces osmophilus]WBW72768.1 hypothetical protein SOMG_00831 [Schizosaccharomyces osmophilus]
MLLMLMQGSLLYLCPSSPVVSKLTFLLLHADYQKAWFVLSNALEPGALIALIKRESKENRHCCSFLDPGRKSTPFHSFHGFLLPRFLWILWFLKFLNSLTRNGNGKLIQKINILLFFL